MPTSNKERHQKWREKQAEAGKKTITVMVDDWVKEMIDNECKRLNCTISYVITKCVLYFTDPSASDSAVEVPIDEMRNLARDLKAIASRIEGISGPKPAVTSNKN